MKQDFYGSHDAGPEWGTPRWVVEPLLDALDGFDLDPASGAEPITYADETYTVDDNGLARDWFGDVWLNPPYGREHNESWARKVIRERERERCSTITALVPASTDTNWFQQYYSQADIFTFIDGRVSFHGAGDTAASFPSVICSFGDFNDVYVRRLDEMGLVLARKDVSVGSVFDY